MAIDWSEYLRRDLDDVGCVGIDRRWATCTVQGAIRVAVESCPGEPVSVDTWERAEVVARQIIERLRGEGEFVEDPRRLDHIAYGAEVMIRGLRTEWQAFILNVGALSSEVEAFLRGEA